MSLAVARGCCEWFTDFKRQPSSSVGVSSTPPACAATRRCSVPITGTACLASRFRTRHSLADDRLDGRAREPDAARRRSLAERPEVFMINCAVCHGMAGKGDGTAAKYGVFPFPLVSGRGVEPHRRLHLRHDPQRPRQHAAVQPHRREGSLGRRELRARAAGQAPGGGVRRVRSRYRASMGPLFRGRRRSVRPVPYHTPPRRCNR